MAVQPTIDTDQQQPAKPGSQVIGFVDNREQLDAVMKALRQAQYPESHIVELHGENGIETLKRLREVFQFGDGENQIEAFALNELRAGHYAVAVDVKNRPDAMRVVNWTKPLGAHSFAYLGAWVNERLTK